MTQCKTLETFEVVADMPRNLTGVADDKILGDGEVTRALKVTAAKFSESAKAKIEKAGGQAIVA